MSNNPYLAWPLWHYFTMNSQNIDALETPTVDRRSPSGSEDGSRGRSERDVNAPSDLTIARGIVVPVVIREGTSSLVTPVTTENTDTQMSVQGGRALATRSGDVVVYDFMNDKIVRLSSFTGPVYIYIANTYQRVTKKPPTGSMVVLKGGRSTNTPNGGDILPFVGEPQHMNLLIQLIAALATGDNFDLRAQLTDEENGRIDNLLHRSVYNTPSVSRILNSYKTCGTARNEDTNLINNIGKKIATIASGKGQPGRSINIERGAFSNSKHDKTIMEFRVKLRQDGQPINVKFSFPQNIPVSKRDYYIDLLKKNFFAEQVHTPSVEERRSTEFNPVRIESSAISSIFGEPDRFSAYVEKVNMLERNKTLDTSATLSSLPSRPLEEEEEYNDEEEDEENYEED